MVKSYITLLLLFFSPVPLFADMIIGGETVYEVVRGDTLEGIGAKLGVRWEQIAERNRLDINGRLRIGLKLKVNNRKIIPKIVENGLIINIPDRTLYYLKNGKLQTALPVGLGIPSWKGEPRWRTPEGSFRIVNKQKNPSWFVPKSIREEMEQEGKPVEAVVPPGHDNPLGRYVLRTSIQGVEIHETIKPASIYQFRSHGCIRVHPEHMERLFRIIEPETTGEIIYIPVKLAVTKEGRVFLEVHRDVYKKINDLAAETRRLIGNNGLANRIDWKKVDTLLREKSGIAEDITL